MIYNLRKYGILDSRVFSCKFTTFILENIQFLSEYYPPPRLHNILFYIYLFHLMDIIMPLYA